MGVDACEYGFIMNFPKNQSSHTTTIATLMLVILNDRFGSSNVRIHTKAHSIEGSATKNPKIGSRNPKLFHTSALTGVAARHCTRSVAIASREPGPSLGGEHVAFLFMYKHNALMV